jgi:basic membrane lipoprotein Med (substrate-binding protein (PBP1-ABC) superfamily)
MMKKSLVILVVVLGLLLPGCAPAPTPAAAPTAQTIIETVEVVNTVIVAGTPQTIVETVVVTPPPEEARALSVFGAYATAIEEPWDGVIHSALQKAQADGRISYEFTDDIGYAGDMERVLREVAEQKQPDIIFGDAFGNEEAVRRVAKDYPEIAFVFGSGGGPAEPNFSVFDNWIHEPAYLSGMLAGGLTKTNVIGVVGGYPVPEVNRIVNAFIAGATLVNPDVDVKTTFISSWFDPAAAKEAALAQIDAGADVLFAERFGVIEAAAENGLYAFGNMSDQKELAPESVISGPVWNMEPTVNYIINQVGAGAYTAQDLKDFSMVAKGGASLAPVNSSVTGGIPQELIDMVTAKEEEIKSGIFRVDIDEAPPPASSRGN